jgi:hypothetical protein
MTWIFWAPAEVRTTSNSSFSSTTGAASPPAAGHGHGHGGRRGHAELLFEGLQQLAELQHGHAGDGVEDLLSGKSHGGSSFQAAAASSSAPPFLSMSAFNP